MAASPDGSSTVLRMVDYFKIPRDSGDCVVLLVGNPDLNLLGRYLPPSKVNDLLLADVSRPRASISHGDSYMMEVEEPGLMEEMEPFDIMDLASFLECVSVPLMRYLRVLTPSYLHRFAIQATHCLEILHK